MTFNVTIFDGGVSVEQTIEAADIDAAVDLMESQCRESETITEGNPDCEPRTNWSAIINGDDYAECSLRGDSRDAQTWAKVTVQSA